MSIKNIYLITIGDELIEGYTRDYNSFWLSQFLNKNGLRLKEISIIGDNNQEIGKKLNDYWQSENCLIITSGGLGPTKDDLTKNALGSFLKTNLASNDQAETIIKKQYKNKNKEWNKDLNHYHHLPVGTEALFNPVGLAPGITYSKESKKIMALPGVPSEFMAMIKKYLLQTLGHLEKKSSSETLWLRTFGIAEEELFNHKIPSLWSDIESWAKLSSLPQKGGVDLVIRPKEEFHDKTVIDAKMNQIINFFKQNNLDQYIWQI